MFVSFPTRFTTLVLDFSVSIHFFSNIRTLYWFSIWLTIQFSVSHYFCVILPIRGQLSTRLVGGSHFVLISFRNWKKNSKGWLDINCNLLHIEFDNYCTQVLEIVLFWNRLTGRLVCTVFWPKLFIFLILSHCVGEFIACSWSWDDDDDDEQSRMTMMMIIGASRVLGFVSRGSCPETTLASQPVKVEASKWVEGVN